MFRVLLDTCVWLEFGRDPKQAPILNVIEEMVTRKLVELIVPRVVQTEFMRNRDRILAESKKSLASHFRIVKDAVGRTGADKRRTRVLLSQLDDVSHKVPIIGESSQATLERIERLLATSPPIEANDSITLRAAARAVDGRAPFHRGRNSMGDALIIETYAECLGGSKSAGCRFAFVSYNKSDFSAAHDHQKLPHPDIADYFSRIKSLYFTSLPDLLRRVDPSLLSDVMLEASFTQEPRGLSEILEAEDLLFHQVWYNRHWNLRIAVEEGRVKVVEKETYPRAPGARETVQRDVWSGALRAARQVEKRFGKKNLGPWDDFEWGMINGKLSALRWMTGDDWDMLDT